MAKKPTKKPTRAAKKTSITFKAKSKSPKRKLKSTTDAATRLKKSLKSSKKIVTLRPKALQTEIVRPLQENKQGRSFSQIVARSPEYPDRYNTQWVSVIKDYPGRVKRLGAYHKAVATKTRTVDDSKKELRWWRQVIFAKDPSYTGKIHKCPAVVVRCECPRHMFYWEYALWKAGAAEILKPNTGEEPKKWNLRHIPGCCKHLVMAYEKLKELNL